MYGNGVRIGMEIIGQVPKLILWDLTRETCACVAAEAGSGKEIHAARQIGIIVTPPADIERRVSGLSGRRFMISSLEKKAIKRIVGPWAKKISIICRAWGCEERRCVDGLNHVFGFNGR
jgi:hypothetical protein